MRDDYPRHLVFGNSFGKLNFDGSLTAFELDAANRRDYPGHAGDTTTIPDEAIPVAELPQTHPDQETAPLSFPSFTPPPKAERPPRRKRRREPLPPLPKNRRLPRHRPGHPRRPSSPISRQTVSR